jgi:excisionase family DNA binding protein
VAVGRLLARPRFVHSAHFMLLAEAMDQVLTVREVANFFRIHPTTVSRMVKRGELPAFRVGSDWRFTLASIQEWLESRTQKPLPDSGKFMRATTGARTRTRSLRVGRA